MSTIQLDHTRVTRIFQTFTCHKANIFENSRTIFLNYTVTLQWLESVNYWPWVSGHCVLEARQHTYSSFIGVFYHLVKMQIIVERSLTYHPSAGLLAPGTPLMPLSPPPPASHQYRRNRSSRKETSNYSGFRDTKQHNLSELKAQNNHLIIQDLEIVKKLKLY